VSSTFRRPKGDAVKRRVNVSRLTSYVALTAVFVLFWVWMLGPAIILWFANR
jgi:hypothetical protein